MVKRGWRFSRMVVCGAGVGLLAACGGDDVDAVVAAQPTETTPSVVVSSATASRLGTEALQAIAANLSSVVATQTAGGVVKAIGLSSAKPAVAQAFEVARAAAQVGTLATSQQRVTCANGGSATTTLTTAGASLAVGDKVSFTFAACKSGDVTTTGQLDLVLKSADVAAFGGEFAELDAVATDLQQTVRQATEKMNGSFTVSFDTRLILPREAGQTDAIANGAALTLERRVNGVVRSTRTIQNLKITRSDVTETLRSVAFASFTADGSFVGLNNAAFKVSTITAIVTPTGQSYPTSGEVQVTGANGTNVIIRIGADTVSLEVDTNGDQVKDQTIDRTWQSVLNDL